MTFVRHVYKGDYDVQLYALYFLRIHVGHMGKFLTDLNELLGLSSHSFPVGNTTETAETIILCLQKLGT